MCKEKNEIGRSATRPESAMTEDSGVGGMLGFTLILKSVVGLALGVGGVRFWKSDVVGVRFWKSDVADGSGCPEDTVSPEIL